MERQDLTAVLAEDEKLLLDNLEKKVIQSETGFAVAGKAQTGTQALELVKNLRPDLLITDIRMPVMDGMELIKNVRNEVSETEIIIVSGYSEFDYARTAIQYSVFDYLLKPIDADELKNSLRRLHEKYLQEERDYNNVFTEEMVKKTPGEIAALLKDFILRHCGEDINLNVIARNMNYSPSYLTKIFSQETGQTPSKFITGVRMQKAQQMLLKNPELSIKQISEMTGFHDQGYFSRIFKKQTGRSPFEFRGQEEP